MPNYCANCGMPVDAAATSYGSCGVPAAGGAAPGNMQPGPPGGYWPQQQPPPQPYYAYPPGVPLAARSRTAYIMLGLFLGMLGIHNFYAGYTGRGLAQLLLNLLLFWTIVVPIGVAVWVIVEICTTLQDADGMAFKP